jgi:drug/metabolite transporter, DME family
MITTTGRLQAVAAAVLFSTGGAGLKADAFTVAQMSGLRSGIASIALLIWLRGRVQLSPAVLVASVAYAATVTLFVASTKLTTAASAIFLQSSAPLYVVVAAPIFLGERFRVRDLLFMTVIAGGLWMSFAGTPASTGTAPDPATGNLLAVVCSMTWALTLLSFRYLERDPSQHGAGLAVAATGNAVACFAALPFGWPLPTASAGEWVTVVFLGVFQIGAAYVCLTAAMRRLAALEVSLLLLIEPVLNPIWTWLVRGEDPGLVVIAGGAVILGATALRAMSAEKPSEPSPHAIS